MKDLSSCGPDDRMVEMLDYWLRHHPTKPTWKDVAHILKKINLYQLADSLMEVYETGIKCTKFTVQCNMPLDTMNKV